LDEKLAGDGSDFTLDDVEINYFESGPSAEYPIGYNNVMVGTFALAVLQDTYLIAKPLLDADIDWSQARAVSFQRIGNNYGAGVTADTNWNAALLSALAGSDDFVDQIYFAPYIDQCDGTTASGCDGIGEDVLPIDTFNLYDQAYVGLQSRVRAAGAAFAGIETIDVADPAPLPGDWGFSGAEDVDDFVRRLKYTFSGGSQLLSNATGFWVPGALADVDWDPTAVILPGFDAGFPEGVTDWPAITYVE